MRINHNIAALNTHRQLTAGNAAQSKSMEKLSSGLRINKAGDDAAGLAISEKMRGQIRGLDMATKNSQDATSMIQTAEGALNETHDILQRMRELAVQSSNDTNTGDDREEIQKEINQLTSEINRIGNTTEFNTKKLLNGDLSNKVQVSDSKTIDAVTVDVTKAKTQEITVGAEPVSWSDDASQVKFDISFSATPAANGFDFANIDTGESNSLSVEKTADGYTLTFAGQDGGGNTLAIDAEALAYDHETDTFSFDNHGISFSFKGSDAKNWAEGETVTIDLAKAGSDVTGGVNSIPVAQELTTNTVADPAADTQATMNNFEIDGDSAELLENVAKVNVAWDKVGGELVVDLQDASGTSVSKSTLSWDGTSPISYASNGISFDLAANDATAIGGTFNLETETKTITTKDEETTDAKFEDRSAVFQIGANQNQSMSLSFSDMRAKALGITGSGEGFSGSSNVTNGTNNETVEKALDVTSAANAAKAITTIDDAIKSVSQERSKLGATQNRLEHTINNLSTSAENLTAAESRIRDVDYAVVA